MGNYRPDSKVKLQCVCGTIFERYKSHLDHAKKYNPAARFYCGVPCSNKYPKHNKRKIT